MRFLFKSNNWLERKCLVVIGLILLNFLYYLKIGLSYIFILVLVGLISIIYLWANLKFNILKKTIVFKIVLFYTACSVMLSCIDTIVNGNTPVFNDFFRVCLYAVYFSWLYLWILRKTDFQVLGTISVWSLALLAISGVLQIKFPQLFMEAFSNEEFVKSVDRGAFRVSGFMIDSNVYAMSFIFHSFIFYLCKLNNKNSIAGLPIFLIAGFFVNLSGSRIGIAMWSFAMFFLIFYIIRSSQIFIKIVLIVIMAAVFLVTMLYNPVVDWSDNQYNIQSSTSRLFGKHTEEAKVSSSVRMQSLQDAVLFTEKYGYVMGPGMLNFQSAWSYPRYPHNGLLFLLSQYGILSLYICFLLTKIAINLRSIIIINFFICFILSLSGLTNAVYYSTFFYCLVFFDVFKFYKHT